MSKAKRVRNIAPPKTSKEPADFTPHQQALISVAIRESNLELLDNLVSLLGHLRAEVL